MCEMPKKRAVSIKMKRRLKFDEKKQGSGIAFAVSSSTQVYTDLRFLVVLTLWTAEDKVSDLEVHPCEESSCSNIRTWGNKRQERVWVRGLERANRFKGVTTVSTLGNASPNRTARGVINTYCSCLNKSLNLWLIQPLVHMWVCVCFKYPYT